MPTERSIAEVEELKSVFSESAVLISTDYRGLNVAAMNALRRALRSDGVQYRISKNTLSRIAADEIGRPEIKELIEGPVGWAYTRSDPSAAAKSLVNHVQDARLEFVIRGALMGDQILSEAQLRGLAKLPGREQLLAMLLAQMNAPIAGLATVLAGPIRGLATVLQRISESMPDEDAAAYGSDDPTPESAATPAADEAETASPREPAAKASTAPEATENPEAVPADDTPGDEPEEVAGSGPEEASGEDKE